MRRSYKGFTLIELLVVISIIAILAAVVISTFTNLQKNTRDAKRKADLAAIQSVLEQYHADQDNYPTVITPGSTLTTPAGVTPVKTYSAKLPQEPNTGRSQYFYAPFYPAAPPASCDNTLTGKRCAAYCLYASLENANNSVMLSQCADREGYDYEVSSP